MTLAEKYRPISFKEVKGQEFAVERIINFIKNFPKKSSAENNTGKKAIILYGPAGTGKTTLAHVAAKELNAELLEINSSDLRNREEFEKIILPASEQKSLFSQTKLILIDEVDGISKVDEGGLSALLEIISSTSFPIIMTANDIWNRKFAELRRNSEVVPVKQLDYRAIFPIIKEICIKESAKISDEDILRVSIKANGDVRAAINDIEVLKHEADNIILAKNLIKRDEKKDIFAILKEVFKGKFSNELLEIYDKTDIPLDEIFLWIDENIPNEYKGEELYKAYNALSLADVYRGRIIRRQHWRFLVYQSAFLSAGINVSKKKEKYGFTSYKRPERILKMWILNQKNAKKKSIIAKYADKNHISIRKASKEFPYIINIIKSPETQRSLGLSEEECGYIMEVSQG